MHRPNTPINSVLLFHTLDERQRADIENNGKADRCIAARLVGGCLLRPQEHRSRCVGYNHNHCHNDRAVFDITRVLHTHAGLADSSLDHYLFLCVE